jgi:hypothetical protein
MVRLVSLTVTDSSLVNMALGILMSQSPSSTGSPWDGAYVRALDVHGGLLVVSLFSFSNLAASTKMFLDSSSPSP